METPTPAPPSSEKSHEKRRWNAFICQDCRAIFRIPADYEGKGVVCPSCDRMLRLPRAGETIPALVQSAEQAPDNAENEDSTHVLQTSKHDVASGSQDPAILPDNSMELNSATVPPGAMASSGEWRRRKKHRSRSKNAENEWQQADGQKIRFSRRLPIAWIWGGAALFIVAISMIAIALLQQSKDPIPHLVPTMPQSLPTIDVSKAKDNTAAMVQLSQIKDAHERIEAFFQARTIEDLMPLLRPVNGLEEKIRRYYIVHSLPDDQYDGIEKQSSTLLADGRCFETIVRMKNQSMRMMTLIKSEGRFQIDWESWVGWSDMNVANLREKKPMEPVEVRVNVEAESYYNYDFPTSMESRWQSFKLTFAEDGQILHGYVERLSPLHQAVMPPSDVPFRPMILRVRYRDEQSHSSQVLIDSVVAEGWVKDLPRE